MKVIVVGGVAGGASCAARLRRLDETAEILMVERGPYISYANCGLPYHIGGIIERKSSLLVATEQMFRERFAIDVRTNCEATEILAKQKKVKLRDVRTGDVTEHLRQAGFVAWAPLPSGRRCRDRPAGDLPCADRARCERRSANGLSSARRSCGDVQLLGHPVGQARDARGGRRRRLHRPGDGGEPGPSRLRRDAGRDARSGPAPLDPEIARLSRATSKSMACGWR